MSVLAIEKHQFQSLKETIIVLAAIGLLFLSAQLAIPYQPVPVTFQSSTVLLLAMILPLRQTLLSISGYLLLGACGLPVFAEFLGGLPILLGVTGGYLLGFLPAALVCNILSTKFQVKSLLGYSAVAFIGTVIIFFCGAGVLANFVGLSAAYKFGVQPFFLTEGLKLILLVFMVKLIKR